MIYVSASLFCGVLMIYMFFNINKIISKKGALLFRIIVFLNFLLIPLYYANYYLYEVKYVAWLFWFSNMAYFILINLAAYTYVLFVYYSSTFKYLNLKKSLLLAIPYLIVIALVLSTKATGLIFYLGDNNEYQRGTLNILHPIVCAGTIGVAALLVLYKSTKEEVYRKKKDLRVVASYALFPCVGGVLEYIMGSTSYILCFALVLGPSILFLHLQNNRIVKDTMTDINEKGALLERLNKKIPYNGKKKLVLFMMDIDNFKHINDEYGHVSGDNAIKDIANCLLSVTGRSRAFVARFGGDEFSVLYELNSEDEAVEFITRLNDKIEENNNKKIYNLSISIGYAVYDDSFKTVDAFIEAADNALYKVKEEYHKNNQAR